MSLFDSLLADLKYGVRSLVAAPAFAVIAMLSLAVGLAAAATSVSLIDSIGLRPLAVADPGTLVRITLGVGKEHPDRAAVADAAAIRANARALSGVAVDEMRGAGLSGPEGPPILPLVEVVSGNFFGLMGVPPSAGRAITERDDESGAAPVVMLSDRFWQRRYGADRGIVGRSIDLNGVAVTVTGIVPPAFNGLNPIVAPDLWMPLNTFRQINRASEQAWAASLANDRDFNVVGRLAPGATIDALQAQLDSAAAQMAAERPDIRHDTTLLAEFDRDVRRRPALILAAMAGTLVGLVVLVGCANVTGLLLGRAEMRRRDMALRAALGATRARLVRQLIAESLVLAAGAGALGLFASWWLIRAVPALLPNIGVPLGFEFRFDAHVLGVTALATLATIGFFGVFPALTATRVNLTDPMKLDRISGWRGQGGGRLAFRRALVAGQVAVAMALVVSSGLLMRNLWNTEKIPLGFTSRPALLVSVAPGVIPTYRGDTTQRFFHDFADALQATPGVTAVTMTRRVPMSANGGGATCEVDIPGTRDANGRLPQIHFTSVAPNYFQVMGTRLLQGPGFPARLGPADPKLVVINEAMAKKYWPGGNALGQALRVTDAGTFEIAGIVETGKYNSVTESPDPYVFFASDQMPSGELTFIIAAPNPGAIAPAVRAALTRLDPRMPMLGLMTLDEHLGYAMYQSHILATTVASLGSAGLGLSLIGLYAVISFMVARRRREIGVRMALGAQPRDVMIAVLRQTAVVAAWGVLAGLVLAGVAGSALASSLVGVSPFDPATYVVASFVVATACLVAVWPPSRRAAKVDPAVTLRE
jgi:putative ABC transport system permease protein